LFRYRRVVTSTYRQRGGSRPALSIPLKVGSSTCYIAHSHSTQHTAHKTQHTAHSTQHPAQHTAHSHSTQDTAYSTQHTAQHIAHSTQHTEHSTQNTADSPVRRIQHTAHRVGAPHPPLPPSPSYLRLQEPHLLRPASPVPCIAVYGVWGG
jgi:hypothetical protein